MPHIFHLVPDNMRGDTLYPLNQLKDLYPDLYREEISKYEGRKEVMEQFIPKLNCKWNDVLHFTAIDPRVIKQALIVAGGNPPEMRFFEIDPSTLPESSMIYLYKEEQDHIDEEEIVPLDATTLAQAAILPERTKVYYKEAYVKRLRPLLFPFVAHVLVKAPVQIDPTDIVVV